ncbi:MAG TPA: hypothetical protein VEU30_07240 [Thermoanaerobaculia bacterium]|nr:hypothetical protein [Thermoanaerobaculia bacterium]
MKTISLLTLMLLIAVPTASQELTRPADLSTPDSPAFTALGVTPQTVSRPSAPVTFAASLLNAVDDQGKLQNGLAIDFTPYLVFHGTKLTLSDYQASLRQRILARTNLSFATTKRTDTDATQRLAAGIHLTIFDAGDPRNDKTLLDCYDRVAEDLLPDPVIPPELLLTPPEPPPSTTPEVAALTKRVDDLTKRLDESMSANFTFVKNDQITQCTTNATKQNRNRSSWIIAAAPVWVSSTGEASDLTGDGGAIWTSLSYGFDYFKPVADIDKASWWAKNAQLIVHARWRANERIKGSDGVTAEHDRRIVGARFRAGGVATIGSVELSHLDDSTGDSSKWRALLGLEQRVTDGVWLQLSFGREVANEGNDEQLVIRSSFRWAFNAAPTTGR